MLETVDSGGDEDEDFWEDVDMNIAGDECEMLPPSPPSPPPRQPSNRDNFEAANNGDGDDIGDAIDGSWRCHRL